jgi:uncharacterized paraquat-inducible protein A
MADVVCPECGQVTTLPAIRRASDEFCSHCDYPLFWAPTAVPIMTQSVSNDATLRRLPGAGGRQMIGTRVCPACGELNSIAEKFCTRCHADMDPQPEPEPELEPEPPPPPPPAPPPPEPKRNWIPWIVLGVVTVLIIIVIIAIA